MLVAICVASRGLVHSRTMDACLANLKFAECDWLPIFEHNKPIPEAQNAVTMRALAAGCEWLWYLEEDVIPPDLALRAMLSEAKVVTAKYRNRGGTWAYSLDRNGRLQYAGMGCLLVHCSVFARLKQPYFASIWDWQWNRDGTVESRQSQHRPYGKQDVHFFAQLWKEGIEARLANIVCGHASVKRYGEPHTNNGCHDIDII